MSQEFASERRIVLLAREGDRAAFSQLVELYDRRLLYFVRRILGEDDSSFDVLQGIWLMVHRKLPTLKSAEAFRVWVYRIAHDKSVSELRKKTRQPLSVENFDGCAATSNASDAESVFDNAELVHVGLQRLSVDHRRILTLRFLEDMKVKEIAAVLGCSDGTIKSRSHQARQALRRKLQEIQNG